MGQLDGIHARENENRHADPFLEENFQVFFRVRSSDHRLHSAFNSRSV